MAKPAAAKISKGDEFELKLENGAREHVRISQVFPPNNSEGPRGKEWAFYYEYLDRGAKTQYGYMIGNDFLEVASPW